MCSKHFLPPSSRAHTGERLQDALKIGQEDI